MLFPFDAGVNNVFAAANWTVGQANRISTYFGFGAYPQESPQLGPLSSFKGFFYSVILGLLDVLMYLVYGAYYSVAYFMTSSDPTALTKQTTFSEIVPVVLQKINELPARTILYALAVVMALLVFALWKTEKSVHEHGYENKEEDSVGESDNSDLYELSDLEADSDGIIAENGDYIESELEGVDGECEEDEGEPKIEAENKSESRKSKTRSEHQTPHATVKNPCTDYKNWFLDSEIDIPALGSSLNESPKEPLKSV